MRLLIVGMTNSVHLARWCRQIADQGWEILVFPSTESENVHPMITGMGLKVHHVQWLTYMVGKLQKSHARIPFSVLRLIVSKFARPVDRSARLSSVIRGFKPEVIHSLETQAAGYLVEETKRRFFSQHHFPPWLHTNWGSDIYLFAQLSKHKERVRQVLESCNYYSCESKRDVELAKRYGFSGKVVACFPNAGGFDIENIKSLREAVRPSNRKAIMLKGYQGWAGRALVGIKALELLGENLKGFHILIYGNPDSEDIMIAGELLSNRTGARVVILPRIESHEEMLQYFASARVYIGLSISDAISTSLLEAMAMGAFPIQSNTSTADEWVVDGKSGAIVPAEEPIEISRRVLQALKDDELVDTAFAANWNVITERADSAVLKKKAVDIYVKVSGR
jgi:glycosyltransferase involved in cell wall biosynthesis